MSDNTNVKNNFYQKIALKYFNNDCCSLSKDSGKSGGSWYGRTFILVLPSLFYPKLAYIQLAFAVGLYHVRSHKVQQEKLSSRDFELLFAEEHFAKHLAEAALIIGLTVGAFRFLRNHDSTALAAGLAIAFVGREYSYRTKNNLTYLRQKQDDQAKEAKEKAKAAVIKSHEEVIASLQAVNAESMQTSFNSISSNSPFAAKALQHHLAEFLKGIQYGTKPLFLLFAGDNQDDKAVAIKQLNQLLYQRDVCSLTIDLSQYDSEQSVDDLFSIDEGGFSYSSRTGSLDKGDIVKAVHKDPFAVIHLTNVEKAYPSAWKILLSVFKEGSVTAGKKVLNFHHAIFILESAQKDDIIFKHKWENDQFGENLVLSENAPDDPYSILKDKNNFGLRDKLFNLLSDKVIPFFDPKTKLKPEVLPSIATIMNSPPDVTLKKFEELGKRVQAQPYALEAITNLFIMIAADLSPPNAPLGVLLFLGPTGVGKTEMAIAIRDTFFEHDGGALLRMDMSHFQEHNMTRLIGSGPGYRDSEDGGQLTEHIKNHPFSIVLLDEFEKAHKNIRLFFLSVFERGFFADAMGKSVDCSKVIFIATTNLCHEQILKHDWQKDTTESLLEKTKPTLQEALRPELFNRFDEVVFFQPFAEKNLTAITSSKLAVLQNELANSEKKISLTLNIDDSANEYLVKKSYSPDLGLRPLQHRIKKDVRALLARQIFYRHVQAKDTVTLYAENGRLMLKDANGQPINENRLV